MSERTNDEWVADLRFSGEQQARALDDLREIIVRGLSPVLKAYVAPNHPEFALSAESIAQKTQQHVLEHLNTFDGHSALTTWVLKFAVRQALLELRQQRWQACASETVLPEIPPAYHELLGQNEFLQSFHKIFKEELTENQCTAIRAMVMFRVPKEEIARQLGLERRDYFNMIHDARQRLKRRLETDGWISGENK